MTSPYHSDGSLVLDQPVDLPDVLDVLIVGGGPAGTAAAFRAKELGLSALVIDFDDLLKRIRDYAKDKLILTSREPEMGEATVEVKLDDYQGDPMEIGFNPAFITDALNVIDTGSITLELKEPNKPGVLRTGDDFTYVLMPVNLQ